MSNFVFLCSSSDLCDDLCDAPNEIQAETETSLNSSEAMLQFLKKDNRLNPHFKQI